MATGYKIPGNEISSSTELSFSNVTIQRPLQLIAGFTVAALLGLIGAGTLATILQHTLKVDQAALGISAIVLAATTVSLFGTAALAALSEIKSYSRLLLPFNFSFLVHYVWFAFAASLQHDVELALLPASLAAVLACSLFIDFCCKLARPERVAAIAYGISPEHLNRLGRGVDVVTGPSNIAAQQYDVLLVDFSVPLPSEWSRFVSSTALTGCEVRHVSNYVVQRTASLLPTDVEPDFALQRRYRSSGYIPFKRAVDIITILLLAPVVLPVIIAAALAILVSMGRPIIFVQDRVGKGGNAFRMYKLRTMCAQPAAEKQNATSRGDVRITPLGKALRRFRIDELPQLLNVLKGDMSLIGPRPEQPQLVAKYRQIIPYYDLRHEVQPGLSGWAQINYGYASTVEETQAKTSYDLFYIKEFGPALDIEIAVATLWVIVRGWNAR